MKLKPRILVVAATSAFFIVLAIIVSIKGTASIDSEQGLKVRNATESMCSSVCALGRLEPGEGIIDIRASADKRVYRVEAKEGQCVKAGDVLAHLSCYPERLARRNHARSELENAKIRLVSEIAHGEAVVAEAEVHLKKVSTICPLEIQAQKAKVRQLEAELETAVIDLKRIEELDKKKSISRQEYDHQKVLVDTYTEDLDSERTVLARLKEHQVYSIREATARLVTAKAHLEKIRNSISIDVMERALETAEARLADSIITAPIDGQILKIHTWPGELVSDDPILQMGDVENMYAVAEVYETDIRFIKLGQKARILSPALPSELTGVVKRIGLTIFKNDVLRIDPAASTDSRVIEVRIKLDDSKTAARYNYLQVDVYIDHE